MGVLVGVALGAGTKVGVFDGRMVGVGLITTSVGVAASGVVWPDWQAVIPKIKMMTAKEIGR